MDPFTMRFNTTPDSYQRTLLNSSLLSGPPIDSPVFTRLPIILRISNRSDFVLTHYYRKASVHCGMFLSALGSMQGLHYFRNRDLLSRKLYRPSMETFSISTCCPCLAKYAESYAHWANVPCVS
eukprot:gene3918-8401_t